MSHQIVRVVHMRDYGIRVVRSRWEKIFAHIPLIRRINYVKVRINVNIFRNHSLVPVEGVFTEAWIPKNTTTLKIQYAVLKDGDGIHASVYSLDYNYKNIEMEYDPNTITRFPRMWYDLSIKIKLVRDEES